MEKDRGIQNLRIVSLSGRFRLAVDRGGRCCLGRVFVLEEGVCVACFMENDVPLDSAYLYRGSYGIDCYGMNRSHAALVWVWMR